MMIIKPMFIKRPTTIFAAVAASIFTVIGVTGDEFIITINSITITIIIVWIS